MRFSRPFVILLLSLAVCIAVAVVAVELVPKRPAIAALQPPVETQIPAAPAMTPVPARQTVENPILRPQDFPALASMSPLTMGQVIPPADLLPPTPEAPPATAPAPVFRLPPGEKPLIAIVIDDMGPNGGGTQRALRLPAPITFAFLPYAQGVAATAAQAKARGHELIVHVPMQPLDSSQNPGPHALVTGLAADAVHKRLIWNLSQFKGYVGINNHMGSRFTADARGMNVVMEELARRDLFFLDSRTIGRTAARATAVQHGVPLLERDVFLDDTDSAAAIAAQLQQTLRTARQRGKAIAIGHPRPLTLTALERWLPEVAAQGYQLVPLSRILEQTVQPTARAGSPHAAR